MTFPDWEAVLAEVCRVDLIISFLTTYSFNISIEAEYKDIHCVVTAQNGFLRSLSVPTT